MPNPFSRLKDKLSGNSLDESDAARAERDAATAFAKDHHDGIMQALQKAKDTGYPAHVGTDMNGHEVFVEPPAGYSAVPQMAIPRGPGMFGGKNKGTSIGKEMEMGRGRGFGIQAGYDPYRDENARFIMPLQKDKRGGGPRGESGWGHGRERVVAFGYGYGYGYAMMGMGAMVM